jgi:Protein of unknown function (DUF2735)
MWSTLRKRDAKSYMCAKPDARTRDAKESNMTTSSDRGSAKIYQFPVRGRMAAGGHRADVTPSEKSENRMAQNPPSPRFAKSVFGSAWYHDEAIRDADGADKSLS